jgi:hypothetical protein
MLYHQAAAIVARIQFSLCHEQLQKIMHFRKCIEVPQLPMHLQKVNFLNSGKHHINNSNKNVRFEVKKNQKKQILNYRIKGM